jgi:glucan phosphoethanolaminetransferase (alkaline phosphatase superfamily)
MKTNQSIFKVFQHNDEYFEMLNDSEFSRKWVTRQILYILLFTFIYGIVMGSYNGFQQSLITGIKIPCLIFLSLLVCFPALFVIQYMIGSTMSLFQMTNVILSGFIVFSTIALSFSPIVVFFMITGDSYSFLKLLHVAIFTFSGIFAVRTITDGLTYSCEKKNVYPKIGMKIFKIWVIILAFVSSQLAWSLRPFIGDRNLPLEIFRARESNFYIAVIHSAANLFEPEKVKNKEKQLQLNNQKTDSTLKNANDQ